MAEEGLVDVLWEGGSCYMSVGVGSIPRLKDGMGDSSRNDRGVGERMSNPGQGCGVGGGMVGLGDSCGVGKGMVGLRDECEVGEGMVGLGDGCEVGEGMVGLRDGCGVDGEGSRLRTT